MAQLVLGAVGAGVGAAFGGLTGAQWGFSTGVLLAGVLFPPKQGVQQRGLLADLNVSGSAYGTIIPIVYGQGRVPCNIIWAPPLTQHVSQTGGGGKGNIAAKPKVKTYTYTFTGDLYVCEGPVGQVRRIWANDILIHNPSGYGGSPITIPVSGITKATQAQVDTSPTPHGFTNGQSVEITGVVGMVEINGLIGQIQSHTSTTFKLNINSTGFTTYSSGGVAENLSESSVIPQPDYLTIFLGTETEVPWSVAEAILGVGNVPAYRGITRLGFNNFDLTPYGNRIPTITAEVAPL